MKGEPALVVGLVDAGSVLHQESHHVDVVVDACLRGERRERRNVRPRLQSCPAARELTSALQLQEKSPAMQLTGCHVVSGL